MQMYLVELLSAVVDEFGSVAIESNDNAVLVRLGQHATATIVGGQFDGVKLRLPMDLGFPGGHALVKVDTFPCGTGVTRDGEPVAAEYLTARVRLEQGDFCHRETIKPPLGVCVYGRNMTMINSQNRIVLSEIYDLVKAKNLDALYAGALDTRRKTLRNRYGIRRVPYYDDDCPQDHCAWFIREPVNNIFARAEISEFVSRGRCKQLVPITYLNKHRPDIPKTIVALPVRIVSDCYLCQMY